MNVELQSRLIDIARHQLADSRDPAHDFNHALNVMSNALVIGDEEGADSDVTVAAALLHDVVHYLPNDHRSDEAPRQSAAYAVRVLTDLIGYPQEKIAAVEGAILTHSPWLPLEPKCLEARVVRDADLLAATGALAIMRTFACAGAMNMPLYSADDPFCATREPNRLLFALDYATTRMVRIPDLLQTPTARRMADERARTVDQFLACARQEFGQVPALLCPSAVG
jgi:uncharacterized protein